MFKSTETTDNFGHRIVLFCVKFQIENGTSLLRLLGTIGFTACISFFISIVKKKLIKIEGLASVCKVIIPKSDSL